MHACMLWPRRMLMPAHACPPTHPPGRAPRSLQALFRRAQLKALVDLHGCEAGFGGTLSEDEIHVIRGALDLTNKTAAKSMTPIEKVFMLSMDDR